jgi:hypothetical protein
MKQPLSTLVQVPLREAWKHEAGDFTPWLAETANLASLGDALGLGELELVATEHQVGDFKLDILCTDGADQVIIENQLERTNHAHLGQIITYAAGIGAKKIIWVAETFRPEHVAALEFLNQNTTEDLNFFAVEIELWRIGDSPLAPKFEVVVKPNEWAKAGREQARAAVSATPTKQLYLRLWTELVARLAKRAPTIRPQKPRPQMWLNNSMGRAGFRLNPTASQQGKRLGVEVYIDHPESKRLFQALAAQREQLEQQLGFALDWQELPEAQACRIASWRPNSPLEEEGSWSEYLDWFVERLVKMNTVFRPAIQALP